MLIIIVIIALLLVMSISLIPVRIFFRLSWRAHDLRITIFFKIWGLPLSFNINKFVSGLLGDLLGKMLREKRPWFSQLQILRSALPGSIKTLHKIAKPIVIKNLRLYTEVALEEAAQTAIAVGVLWWYWGILSGQIHHFFKKVSTVNKVSIIPNYQARNLLNIDFSCIFEFPLGHIIIIIYFLSKMSRNK